MRRLAAVAVAAVVSGAPSTFAAWRTGRDPWVATRAAASLIGGDSVVAGAAVHAGVSLWWGLIVGGVVRRVGVRSVVGRAMVGAGCGAAIAGLDLELIGRRLPAIARLDRREQWIDHLAFGVVVGGLTVHT
jgi:hypothetical protein